jgi:TolB-like protein/DNA-binding winged helix-turn-helix (wHTH) protein/tetratricopeptide (TPR) repeat protein
MPLSAQTVRFGPFQLDLRAAELQHNGTKTKLPEQPFQILVELVEHAGEVVSREELRQRLWRSDTFVDFEHGLNTAVKRLREALGDSAENPRYIETLPRHGYRLMVPVERVNPLAPAPTHRWKIAMGASALLVLAVIAGLFWKFGWREHFRPVTIQSLAVLPLENLSGNPEEEYFADGMTEALITELGKVHALRVISRQSIMRYKGTNKTVPQIARELYVDAVVEGSALRAGDKVRITTQLVQANPERHLWSESYERDLSDVITLQREVARAIVREIRVALTPQEQQSLATSHPVPPEGYEAYLKGRYHFDRFSVEDIRRAREWFQRAIEKDPQYAPAYAWLGWTYTLSPSAWVGSVRGSYERAEGLAQKAIALDDTLAEGHMVLAEVRREYDWNWAGAEEESKRAISINPSSANAHASYAALLSYMARHDEALKEAKVALQLDPVAHYTNMRLGYDLYWARRYDEAIEQFQKTVDLDRNYSVAYYGLGRTYLEQGKAREALLALEKGNSLSSAVAKTDGILGYAYGAAGNKAKALKIIDELKSLRNQRDPDATFDLVRVYTGLGDKDRALDFLQKAYEEHYPSMEVIQVDPQFDRLRSDPRFQELLRRMNFPNNARVGFPSASP